MSTYLDSSMSSISGIGDPNSIMIKDADGKPIPGAASFANAARRQHRINVDGERRYVDYALGMMMMANMQKQPWYLEDVAEQPEQAANSTRAPWETASADDEDIPSLGRDHYAAASAEDINDDVPRANGSWRLPWARDEHYEYDEVA